MNLFSMRFVAEFAELLTTALMHFVWQGAVLTLMLLVLVKMLDVKTARLRYLLSVGTFLMMGMAPFLTISLHLTATSPPRQSAVAVSTQSNAIIEIPSDAAVEANSATVTTDGIDLAQPVISATPRSANIQIFVLIAWLAGVLILSTRLAIGFGVTLWIRANVKPLSEQFEQRVRILGDRLRVVARNRVFTCVKVGQAVAVGFIHPVVLIPIAWLTQLTPDMLEAVIAHELAHIRRWDLWVNLVQRVIETLLFYHPAVWWVSGRIRLEREMCCDEIAAGCFDRAMYARSLESVARIAHGNLLMAASINGAKKMNLLSRIRYLLGVAPADAAGNWWAVGFVAMVLPFAAVVTFSLTTGDTPSVAMADDQFDVSKAAENDSESESRNGFEGTKAGDRKELVSGIAFRWCPAGKFTMGEYNGMVDIELTKGFWLGETEITQGQWKELMGTTPWKGKDAVVEGGDYAASYIIHDDAVSFCQKLTSQERESGRLPQGWKYSLPTEAQWEYACRAGSKTQYFFGDNESMLGEYAWFNNNAADVREIHAHRVGQKKPNAWGLQDMHGNVQEWCSNRYDPKLAGGREPQGPSTGSYRVIRGGGWGDAGFVCRSAFRLRLLPENQYSFLGFRLAAIPAVFVDNADESEAIEKIESLGGKVTRDKSLPGRPVIDVNFQGSQKITDDNLHLLKAFPSIRSLGLEMTRISDAGLKEIQDLKQLTTLKLGRTAITGVGLKELNELKNLTSLELWNSGITDADLRQISELKHLTMLDLTSTQITDAGLIEVSKLKNLAKLNLCGNDMITDAGLKELGELKGLTELDLGATQIADEGMTVIGKFSNLTMLNLSNTLITDIGVTEIKELTNLTKLDLSSAGITDQSMKVIGGLKNLKWLFLSGMGPIVDGRKITDEGLKEIKNLEHLTILNLSSTQITDVGLKEIKQFKNLTNLNLINTQITDQGLKELTGLKNLESLAYSDFAIKGEGAKDLITDVGIKELKASLPMLKIVRINVTRYSR